MVEARESCHLNFGQIEHELQKCKDDSKRLDVAQLNAFSIKNWRPRQEQAKATRITFVGDHTGRLFDLRRLKAIQHPFGQSGKSRAVS